MGICSKKLLTLPRKTCGIHRHGQWRDTPKKILPTRKKTSNVFTSLSKNWILTSHTDGRTIRWMDEWLRKRCRKQSTNFGKIFFLNKTHVTT